MVKLALRSPVTWGDLKTSCMKSSSVLRKRRRNWCYFSNWLAGDFKTSWSHFDKSKPSSGPRAQKNTVPSAGTLWGEGTVPGWRDGWCCPDIPQSSACSAPSSLLEISPRRAASCPEIPEQIYIKWYGKLQEINIINKRSAFLAKLHKSFCKIRGT